MSTGTSRRLSRGPAGLRVVLVLLLALLVPGTYTAAQPADASPAAPMESVEYDLLDPPLCPASPCVRLAVLPRRPVPLTVPATGTRPVAPAAPPRPPYVPRVPRFVVLRC